MCALAAVSLIPLWVRSHTWCDTLYWNAGNPVLISLNGKIQIGGQPMITTPPMPPPVLHGPIGKILVFSMPFTIDYESPISLQPVPNLTLPDSNVAMGQLGAFSHLSAIVLLASVGLGPWIAWRWRFSLRTLLIAITLLAGVLGLVVYLNRAPTVPRINIGDFGQ
jgi:hypothetical protein